MELMFAPQARAKMSSEERQKHTCAQENQLNDIFKGHLEEKSDN